MGYRAEPVRPCDGADDRIDDYRHGLVERSHQGAGRVRRPVEDVAKRFSTAIRSCDTGAVNGAGDFASGRQQPVVRTYAGRSARSYEALVGLECIAGAVSRSGDAQLD